MRDSPAGPQPLQTVGLDELLARTPEQWDTLEQQERDRWVEAADRLTAGAETITYAMEAHTVTAHIDGSAVGYLEWDPTTLEISTVETHPGLRRRGIATAMLNAAHRAGVDIKHSPARTSAGDAWARTVATVPLPDRDADTVEDAFDSTMGWPAYDAREPARQLTTPAAADEP